MSVQTRPTASVARSFSYASAISSEEIALAAYRPTEDNVDGNYYELVQFRERDRNGPWRRRVLPTWIITMTPYRSGESTEPCIACLTSQRIVYLPGLAIAAEMLPDTPRSLGGALRQIKQIGNKLYVCGSGGEIYRRDEPERWTTIEPELLESFRSPDRTRGFNDIDGPSEDEIYICGRQGIHLLTGEHTTRVTGVPGELTAIHIEDEKHIWICGWEGVLLRGNHRDGFRRMGFDPRNRQMFTSVAKYGDVVYLGSAGAFYKFEGGLIDRVDLSSVGNPDIHRVYAIGGVVWAGGASDIIRFDGHNWTRIEYPTDWP